MSNWDQRIPNEPLYERQFLIERPPIIPQDRPHNTSLCMPTCRSPASVPYLLMDHGAEKDAMNYWYYHVVNNNDKGVNIGCPRDKSLDEMTQQYPNRPWLHSTQRNIDHDSYLSRQPPNRRDCVDDVIQHDLNVMNRNADQALLRQMSTGQLFRNGALSDGRLWNQSTSVRGGTDEEMLRSCTK